MNIRKRFGNKRIGVIYGGRSAERGISLLTGKAILKSLLGMGFKAAGIDAGRNLPSELKKKKIAFAYIALHGPWGEDGTVQGLLEIMGIPYTGCGVASSALTMNKVYSKMLFDSCKLPTPRWYVYDGGESRFGYPVVVKPASQGSAYGVSIPKNRKQFSSAVRKARRYGKQVLVEKFIKGTEITVGVLGSKALPAVEIVPVNEFYDFESKYKPGMSRHIIPPRLPSGAVKKSGELAVRAFRAAGCRAVSRVDIIVDKKNNPWLLEINTIPGMTETSLLPDAARAAGMDFGGLVLKIIENSL
jgi:D-alanine-D-alanine ligase